MSKQRGSGGGQRQRYNSYNRYNATSGALKEYPQERRRTADGQRRKGHPNKAGNKQVVRGSGTATKKRTRARIERGLAPKKLGVGIYAAITLVFLLGIGMTVAGSNVTLQRNINNQLLGTLRELEIQNSQISAEIVETRNLEEVEYIARTRLGMSTPLPHQIIQVEVMPERELVVDFNEPVTYDRTVTEQVSDVFSRITHFFSGR